MKPPDQAKAPTDSSPPNRPLFPGHEEPSIDHPQRREDPFFQEIVKSSFRQHFDQMTQDVGRGAIGPGGPWIVRQWQPGDASDQFSGRQSTRVPGQAGFFGALAQPRVSAVGKSGGVRQQMLNGDLAFRRNRLVPGGEHAWLSKLRYVS